MILDQHIKSVDELPALLDKALKYGVDQGLCSSGKEVVVLSSTSVASGGAYIQLSVSFATNTKGLC